MDLDEVVVLAKSKLNVKSYAKFREKYVGICTLCDLRENKILEETKNFRMIENKFPYVIWENMAVAKCLMLVPRRHLVNFGEFTEEELDEFVKIIAKYEVQGFSIYARAPQNIERTQTHQHTHLVKTGE